MILTLLAIVVFVLALLPVGLFFVNLPIFEVAEPKSTSMPVASCSILIPARNEERSIGGCIEAALANVGVTMEVIVLDDQSTDATAQIVRGIASRDPRLRLESAPSLPLGWCGKQHACHVLAGMAAHEHLLFIDADLQLAPQAAARAISLLHESGTALVSAFPRQQTGSFLERLLIPMIHVILLCYLPLREMRRSNKSALAAGCGQFFLTRRADYDRAGGHAAIRASLHDGIALPRAYRAAGLRTDVFDGTDICVCRMYRSNVECWHGLAKNAIEGLAAPRAIVPWTVLLLGGHVLPFALLPVMIASGKPVGSFLCAIAALGLFAIRAAAAVRFREPWLGVILHPLGVLILIAIQWTALFRHLFGRPAIWKDRQYCGSLGIAPGDHGV